MPNGPLPAADPNAAALPPIFRPLPIPLGHELIFGGALDLRTRTSTTGRDGGIWINNAELDVQHPITVQGQPRGNIVVQVMAEDPPDVPNARNVDLGQAYLLYRLPIQNDTVSSAFIKVGQFQLPFALLAVYDPHLSIVQPLYEQSLGLRNDFGIGLTGSLYGYLQYDVSLTTGHGPNQLNLEAARVVTIRLGRTFSTRNGVVTIGGSLLSGRLPVTDLSAANPFAVELPLSGDVTADRTDIDGDHYTPKTRIAGDGSYDFKNITARGEAMVGADKTNRVLGYYAEGDYRFTRRATAIGAYSLFVYPYGNSSASRGSTGLSYALSRELSFSAIYQYLRDVPSDAFGEVRHRLTFQLLLRF